MAFYVCGATRLITRLAVYVTNNLPRARCPFVIRADKWSASEGVAGGGGVQSGGEGGAAAHPDRKIIS